MIKETSVVAAVAADHRHHQDEEVAPATAAVVTDVTHRNEEARHLHIPGGAPSVVARAATLAVVVATAARVVVVAAGLIAKMNVTLMFKCAIIAATAMDLKVVV